MTRSLSFLFLSLVLQSTSAMDICPHSSRPCTPRKLSQTHNKKHTQSSPNSLVTLKALSAAHGSRVACALHITNTRKQCSEKEKKFLRELSYAEQCTSLNASRTPIQTMHLLSAFLPQEIRNRIACYIAGNMSGLHYKTLKAILNTLLNNAQLVCFNPCKKDELIFTHGKEINTFYKGQIIQTTSSINNAPDIQKIMYHPTQENTFVANRGSQLVLYENDTATIWDKVKVKDFCALPDNKLLVYPDTTRLDKSSTFDYVERDYSASKSSLTVSPETNHIARDPHNADIFADTSSGYLRTFDMKTQTLRSITPICKNHGTFKFDPHHAYVVAYISGRYLRILDLEKQKQCAQLPHDSNIIDFDFNPHVPYELTVTQKNGKTMQWSAPSSKKAYSLDLDTVVRYVSKGQM